MYFNILVWNLERKLLEFFYLDFIVLINFKSFVCLVDVVVDVEKYKFIKYVKI